MKKFRFMLPALVFALTFAFSFASVSDMFVTKYAYQDTSVSPNVCRELQSNPCDNVDNFTCTVISATHGGEYQVFSSDVPENAPAECSIQLRNSQPEPILVP